MLGPYFGVYVVTLGGIFRFGVLDKRLYGGIAWGVNVGMGNWWGLFWLSGLMRPLP